MTENERIPVVDDEHKETINNDSKELITEQQENTQDDMTTGMDNQND